MNDSHAIAETIFVTARDVADERQRASYLAKACGEDRALRERVERMLKAEEKANQFLADNPFEIESRLTFQEATALNGTMIGCYKLLQQIGEGGCGMVYMAEQEEPIRRRVALKLIKPGMDSRQVIARFEAERQALAMMDHPNIARVLDAGTTENGRPYFVMELVRGIKITEYCDQNNLGTRERLELFTKVVQAVQHAHQKGIIHRDLKPSNVLVTLHDGVPVPKVIDFGIAKAMEQKLTDKTLFTQFEQFIGTPAYTSPEQAEMSGLDVDTRSDIYSLGVLLYELLVGTTPFDTKELLRSGLNEMRRIIREKEPDRPSTRLSTLVAQERTSTAQRRAVSAPELMHLLKGDLDWIVMKCLEKDRTRRYETASGLTTDIENYLKNEPVLARPPSAAYRLGKLVRRNKLAVGAGAAVILALVFGIVASLWQAKRARNAEQTAKTEKESAEAILTFFREKILAAGRPEEFDGGLGKDVTLRKAIDSAEAHIAEAFKDRPSVEAAVRETIGQSYTFLGEYSLALDQLERALSIAQREFGASHARTLKVMDALATAYFNQGKVARAVQINEQVFAIRKSTLGRRHEDTIRTMMNLGISYSGAEEYGRALPLLEEVLKLQTAVAGAEAHDTLVTMMRIGRIHQNAERLDQALPLFEKAVKGLRAKWPNYQNTLAAMNELGYTYEKLGKIDQGLPLVEEAFKRSKGTLGPGHAQTTWFLHDLCFFFARNGRDNEAEELIAQALAEVRADPAATARVLWIRGEFRRTRNRLDEAIASYTDGIQAYPDPFCFRSRGVLRARLGKFSEAAADFAQALQLQLHAHELYHSLASCIVQSGNLEAYGSHCREIVARFGDTEDPMIAHRMAKDCSVLPDSGIDPGVLERWAEKALTIDKTLSSSPWFLASRALAHYRLHRYGSAIEMAQRVMEKSGEQIERDVQTWAILAMARHQLHQSDEARSALAQAVKIAETKLPKLESGDLGSGWVDWPFAHALLREARALIEPGTK